MKEIKILGISKPVPQVAVGCMRFYKSQVSDMNSFIHEAMDEGCFFFDHADIYGGGVCEELFGKALAGDSSLKREDMIIQSKCGVRLDIDFDLSKEHILKTVDGSLKRLQTDYLDILLLHRPDALMEPEEIAEAFDILQSSGKVRAFGVSNFKPMQIELVKKCVTQPLVVNQIQFSIPASSSIAASMEMNLPTEGAVDRDGNVLDYCRLHDITLQAWSPFQTPDRTGLFFTDPRYDKLNAEIKKMAEKYGVSETTMAAAWIFRHPAKIQLVSGTTKVSRFKEILAATDVKLSREDWYALYFAAGHIQP